MQNETHRRAVWCTALIVAFAGRTAVAQLPSPSILGADLRVRQSEIAPWERGVATAVVDTGLTLRQRSTIRFIPRDSIVYLERRAGKDWSAIAHVMVVTSVVGLVVGERLGRGDGGDLSGIGSAYGELLGVATGALVGGVVGVFATHDRWNQIDVGLVFRR